MPKSPTPRRRRDWLAVFGTDTIPLRSPIPHTVYLPSLDGPQLIYEADLAALTPDQRQLLIIHIASRFQLSMEVIARALDAVGLPILASDVIVTSNDAGLLRSSVDEDDKSW